MISCYLVSAHERQFFTFQILQTEQRSAAPLLRKSVCQEAFDQVKIMTTQNKSCVTRERLSQLKSKYVQEHGGYTQEFKQTSHSQKRIQVKACSKE